MPVVTDPELREVTELLLKMRALSKEIVRQCPGAAALSSRIDKKAEKAIAILAEAHDRAGKTGLKTRDRLR